MRFCPSRCRISWFVVHDVKEGWGGWDESNTGWPTRLQLLNELWQYPEVGTYRVAERRWERHETIESTKASELRKLENTSQHSIRLFIVQQESTEIRKSHETGWVYPQCQLYLTPISFFPVSDLSHFAREPSCYIHIKYQDQGNIYIIHPVYIKLEG